MEYNKLIRDRIPEIIQADGKVCEIEVMDQGAFRTALRSKLVEEAGEVAEAGSDLVKEIADLYEVIDSLIAEYNLDEQVIRSTQTTRREQRGGFMKRLKLIRVD